LDFGWGMERGRGETALLFDARPLAQSGPLAKRLASLQPTIAEGSNTPWSLWNERTAGWEAENIPAGTNSAPLPMAVFQTLSTANGCRNRSRQLGAANTADAVTSKMPVGSIVEKGELEVPY
jgi:hypothetical protein